MDQSESIMISVGPIEPLNMKFCFIFPLSHDTYLNPIKRQIHKNQKNNMIQQTAIVSGASTFALTLCTALAIFLYRIHIRPETMDLNFYRQAQQLKIDHLNKDWAETDRKYNTAISLIDKTSSNEKFPESFGGSTDLENNPIKDVFRKLSQKEVKMNLITHKDEKIEIEAIEFPSKIVTAEFQREIVDIPDKDDEISSSTEQQKVVLNQIGLKLETPTLAAAVYKIQNLFGNVGLVGHYFFVVKKEGSMDSAFIPKTKTFENERNLKGTLKKNESLKNYNIIFLFDSDSKYEEVKNRLVHAINREKKEIQEINKNNKK